MNTHPYLRAFLAGILVPTLVLPLLLLAFIVLRLGMQISFPIERGLVFPMALVPGLWGIWSMLWQASRETHSSAIGSTRSGSAVADDAGGGIHRYVCGSACTWEHLQQHGSTRFRFRMR